MMGAKAEIGEAYWHLKAALRVDGSITINFTTNYYNYYYNNCEVQE